VTQLGNVVAVAPYGMSGSGELACHLSSQLDNQCNAYILQNHGVICMGTTMGQTAVNVQVLEKVAHVYQAALATGKPLTYLPEASEKGCFEMLKSEQRKEVRRKKRLEKNKE
jgi:L-fuculose-phosphate aldolase